MCMYLLSTFNARDEYDLFHFARCMKSMLNCREMLSHQSVIRLCWTALEVTQRYAMA